MSLVDDFQKLLSPLKRRVFQMVARGKVTGVTDGKAQKIQMMALDDEVLDGLDYLEPYGFTSVPKVGAEAVALFLGGSRDHGLVVNVADRRYKIQGLSSLDVAIYHQDGTKIVLKGGGKIQVINPAGNELFAVLSELLTMLINSRTTTSLGPQPLFDVTGADTFAAIKTKIDSFKV